MLRRLPSVGLALAVAASTSAVAQEAGTKAHLEWDRAAERFTSSEDANRRLTCRYRSPHVLPERS